MVKPILTCISFSLFGPASQSECSHTRIQVRSDNTERSDIAPQNLVLLLPLFWSKCLASDRGLTMHVLGTNVLDLWLRSLQNIAELNQVSPRCHGLHVSSHVFPGLHTARSQAQVIEDPIPGPAHRSNSPQTNVQWNQHQEEVRFSPLVFVPHGILLLVS